MEIFLRVGVKHPPPWLIGLKSVADLRRRPKGAMPPLREETAINKAPKLLL